jgi:hypothetical protein
LSARENHFSSRLLVDASGGAGKLGASTPDDAIRAGGAGGSCGASGARLCQKRKAPVRSRKQAAAPLENAPRRFSFNIRRFGMAKLASGTDGVNGD